MREFIKYILFAVVICILGFCTGYYFLEEETIDANNSAIEVIEENSKETNSTEDEGEIVANNSVQNLSDSSLISSYFDTSAYTSVYNKDTLSYKITLNKSIAKGSQYATYKREDVFSLAKDIVEPSGEFKISKESEYTVRYEEYDNGKPTGGYASFVFDESGVVVQAYFRKGVVYGNNASKEISYEKAFELAMNAIYEQCGEDVIIEGKASDYQYETYYRPASQNVCYLIKNIKGYMNSDKKESGEYVEFFVTVAMDGSFVEVASTN